MDLFGAYASHAQAVLCTPVRDKYSILMEDDKIRVGTSSMQGWRSTMEDAHAIHLSLPNLPLHISPHDAAMAAVFDGHSGCKTAQFAATHMARWITSSESFVSGNVENAIFEAFISGDAAIRRSMPHEQSGCTGNCIVLVQNNLYCGNVGDSRAVMCRGGVPLPLSEDHKPTLLREKERIKKAGYYVRNGRVNGILSLSRALGDFAFKDHHLKPEDQAISAVPDVLHVKLTPQDEFVVIACDGVWEKFSNERVVKFVREEVGDHGDLSLACERLMDSCLAPVSAAPGADNMTVIIVQFKSSFLKRVEDGFADDHSSNVKL
ncbi:protein phosphatase 2C, putative [Trypanosoma brucei gambiense DAL972]|uniref:Protein phosphatase 2C, putative n=1 Tax=Trypanosoma brucei gambiense (strain MHOM/CI/86/DAL972) TaxID=679716 RepID=C9ZJK2_TRYB9|nr:protein phosphatase 2C, putative [Trypanosoma brucei gambiense DAL972]CBH09561.1 protein phosphatase 2C, putative [Trypanosoma brucei gambiense DAL972]|eukprot:XP_011771866.1 protein phosphatase 2C, putative [Trypanosoma brucei gambiense DAL972]